MRTYRNTYVCWICSVHNGKGVDVSPSAIVIDENESMDAIQAYFTKILESKNIIRYVVDEFNRIYKAKGDNEAFEQICVSVFLG